MSPRGSSSYSAGPRPAHERREPGVAGLRDAQVELLEARPAPARQQRRARRAQRRVHQVQLLERREASQGGGAERVRAGDSRRGPDRPPAPGPRRRRRARAVGDDLGAAEQLGVRRG
jgi:hypothetical protein